MSRMSIDLLNKMPRRGVTIWLTGLSGAGKTTISERLVVELTARGRAPEVLDGDVVRTHLSKGLGFSKEDRDTNVRRIGFVASLVTRQGGVVIAAAISPYREARDEARRLIADEGKGGGFVEVYVECPIEELVKRDVKGLYAKALRGEIANFTGVSDPYEPPLTAEVVAHTDKETVEESVAKIVAYLEAHGYLPRPSGDAALPGAPSGLRAFGPPSGGSAPEPPFAAAAPLLSGLGRPHGGTLVNRVASVEQAAEWRGRVRRDEVA